MLERGDGFWFAPFALAEALVLACPGKATVKNHDFGKKPRESP